MKFGEPKFERDLELEEQERREGEQKLEKFLGEIAEKLRKEGAPLNSDCRIDMKAFSGVYSREEIEKDQKAVKKYEERQQEPGKRSLKQDGEKLEALKTAIFYKFLGKKFVVARASLYDDIENKIDNLILEKETGNLVCAFDEVSDVSFGGVDYEKKKNEVLKRDIKEGGELKYGLKLEKDEKNQMRLILGEVSKIPILYLALDKRRIYEGVKNLIPSFEEKSEYEEKLWKYFTASLDTQIQYLNIEPQLKPDLRDRLEHFQNVLQKE